MKNGYDEDEAAQRGFRETWLKEVSNIELGQGATPGVITNTNFQHIGFATRRYHETCDRPYFRPMNQSSCQEVPLHNHDLSDHPILCRSFALSLDTNAYIHAIEPGYLQREWCHGRGYS